MMGWFQKKKPAPSPDEPVQPQPQKSLALNGLFHQFREGRKYRVLDLGPAVAKNVEFFAQVRCRLQIEDLYGTLSSFDYFSPEDGFSYEAVMGYLMPFHRSASFDVILAWDLPNYLDREVLRHLIQHLSRSCRSGTLLFMWVATSRYIPETPLRFQILDEETLLCSGHGSVLRPSPHYEASDLTRLMPRFRVCNSFALRNGYREYLMAYE
jgi:hypothetical protein